ncbi:SIS domain-containing protein (plasmid) [Paraburkholderia sp. D15]|uniref:SIS domain-containing protein n=1 Tax=Paraburkholderia sp. D15 TaxID=2880218 RepID=UPI00247AEFC2|nr:SIS domain-containing protein [Paraburkholderia sp. D15]WGS55261.1 SIS domain-containing protein [Paraburkholderia sp. D15]
MQNHISPYERDISDQLTAIADQLAYELPPSLRRLDVSRFDRIVLTGMGSSHYATIPIERGLAARGLPVWRIDTGSLLDFPELITGKTLLWATSQSGMSGEIVALLNKLEGATRPATIIGVTNDEQSTLARRSDILVALKSGSEATVSSKSYVNTLIAAYRTALALRREDEAPLIAAVRAATAEFARLIDDRSAVQSIVNEAFLGDVEPRVALVGMGADGATTMTGALILKEACKVMAEGYLSGEFRHGPMETSGPGMITLLIGDGTDATLQALSEELTANGTEVVTIGPKAYVGSKQLQTSDSPEIVRLIAGMLYVQHFTILIARAKGLVPGEFIYGRKVTVTI